MMLELFSYAGVYTLLTHQVLLLLAESVWFNKTHWSFYFPVGQIIHFLTYKVAHQVGVPDEVVSDLCYK